MFRPPSPKGPRFSFFAAEEFKFFRPPSVGASENLSPLAPQDYRKTTIIKKDPANKKNPPTPSGSCGVLELRLVISFCYSPSLTLPQEPTDTGKGM